MINKIKIPWYRRNVRVNSEEDETNINSSSFDFPKFPINPPIPRQFQPQTVRQPQTQSATEPIKEPVNVPVLQPSPFLEPNYKPSPFPTIDGGYENHPYPIPVPIPELKDNRERNKLPNPQPSFLEKAIEIVAYLFVLRENISYNVKVNLSDPIYREMLNDPVLGFAIREGEKANLDMDMLVNYFANYDYDNFNLDEMTKELTTLFGAGATARIIVYFLGRKVVFRY